MMTGQMPRLGYSQLFSFQVAHNLEAAQQAGERYHVNLQTFKDLLKNKSVLRAGILVRKAKTQFKKDERYCVLVPGKLFMFKNPNLPGQHVRYVTSLMGASVRMLQGLEFELLVPGTKTLTLLLQNVEEVTGWMGALERSVEIAQQLLAGGTYEQQDQVPNNMFASMNPGTMASMMPGPSSGKGGFIQTHNHGAYTNPQDSRALQQRLVRGLGRGMLLSAQPQKPLFNVTTTHLGHSTPFGATSPYAGNFQANIAQGNRQNRMLAGGNIQNPMGVGNFQTPGRIPLLGVYGQAGFMGQRSAGPSTSYDQSGMNQAQGNSNNQNQFRSGVPGMYQGSPQGWGQDQQIRNAPPGETGVRMIRRATQTLREFNNNMDKFLAQPSSSGYGCAAQHSQNLGFSGGPPQAHFQGYGGPQQSQFQVYGVQAPRTQLQEAPQAQAQVQGYVGAQKQQLQVYGRGGAQAQGQEYASGAPQPQGYGAAQQGQVQRYGGGVPQARMQNSGASRQAQVQQSPPYRGGTPQIRALGYWRGAPQMSNPGYGRGTVQMQNPRFARAGPMMPQQQYPGPAPGMAPAASPDDWKEFTSPDGRTYYYHERTRQTTWTRPY